jgi:hypothetical protein
MGFWKNSWYFHWISWTFMCRIFWVLTL